MPEEPRDSGISLTGFFDRSQLAPGVRYDCHNFVQSLYCHEFIRPVAFQGYCSYTIQVGEETIVQFRPAAHELPMEIVILAREIFHHLVPATKYLGELSDTSLRIYAMGRLGGVSLPDLRADTSYLKQRSLRERLVKDFAQLQVTSWEASKSMESVTKRLVGSSIEWRAQLVVDELPSRFQTALSMVKTAVSQIKSSLPWTLSHGDLIPSNIMTCPDTGQIVGLLDWAEAEFLPFGVGMYGLEELLGDDSSGRFMYYPDAKQLRGIFWTELASSVPVLARDSCLSSLVRQAQILGIFLWHGIAFDDGKLNRAVQEGRDDEELARLDAFILSTDGAFMQMPQNGILRWPTALSIMSFGRLGLFGGS